MQQPTPIAVVGERRSWRAVAVACGALLLVVVAFALIPTPAGGQTSPVCDSLAVSAEAHAGVTLGVVYVDLATGESCEVDSERSFRSASLYKNVVLAELHRQVEAGAVSLGEPLTLEPRHSMDDPPELRLQAPVQTTVGAAAREMIVVSSNPAAEAVMERLGPDAVVAATGWLGMPDTTLGEVYATTPADQAHFFRLLYEGGLVSAAASEAMVGLYLDQGIQDLVRAAIPGEVPVAHKTGTLLNALNDAGIVYAPSGDFVLVVLTEHSDTHAAAAAIRAVASAVFEAHEAHVASGSRGAPAPVDGGAAAPSDGDSAGDEPVAAETSGDSPGAESAATTTPGAAVVLGESGGGAWFDVNPGGVAVAVGWPEAALGLGLVVVLLAAGTWTVRRRTAQRYVNLARSRGLDERAAAGGTGAAMRFGSRGGNQDDGQDEAPAAPASHSVSEVALQPVMPSKRLQRVAEHFHSQTELLTQMREQFEEEMEPLHDLLVRQNEALQQLLRNLEERLRPLNEYADGEEANLAALERRIQEGGTDHVARSFDQYLDEQRRRIDETRAQIDAQRVPFVQYGEDQRMAVEVALSRFDDEIEHLEANLAEQRRVMMRMLDAMRSEAFASVTGYLASRAEVLARLAEEGSADPGEIGRAVKELRGEIAEAANASQHARSVLEHADEADQRLAASAVSGGPRSLPHDEPPAQAAGDEEAEPRQASGGAAS